MTARTTATTPAETYTAAQLPEVLRSKLVAGVITARLKRDAQELLEGGDAGAQSLADLFAVTAQEIQDWHDQKPSPDHMNGGAVPPRFGDPS
jgi:hypothetical protein